MELKSEYSPAVLFPDLKLGIYRLAFRAGGIRIQSSYAGSKWRGLWGTCLKETMCPWSRKDCQGCLLSETCPVYRLFYKQSAEAGFQTPPRTYMLIPVSHDADKLVIDMKVFSPSEDLLAPMIDAWKQVAEKGFGFQKRVRFESLSQYQPDGEWKSVLDSENTGLGFEKPAFYLREYLDHASRIPHAPWRFEVVSPMRLRKNGKNAGEADMGFALTALGNRLSVMNSESGGPRLSKDDWLEVKSFLLNPGAITTRMRFFDWKRFSNPQNKFIPMGGLIGDLQVTPAKEREDTWWLWWQTACLVHLGKGVSMGMGKIRPVA